MTATADSRAARTKLGLALAAALLVARPAAANSERAELLELKNTLVNLVDALVAQQVLSAEQAAKLKQEAAAKAKAQVAQEAPAVETEPLPQDAPGKKVVRVPYVPQFVKDEIRRDVKAELRQEVAQDVAARAKEEKWGTKDALPDWANRFELSGDFRLRYQLDTFDDENQPFSYPNFRAINRAGSVSGPDTFFNFTEDRQRLRWRFRYGFTAQVTDDLFATARFATGDLENPITAQQTAGNDFNRWTVGVDRAYLRWRNLSESNYEWISAQIGRFQVPFFVPTELLFDNDLQLEGLAATGRYRFDLAGNGPTRDTGVWLTLGGFPMLERELAFDDDSSNDKWLLGGQLGLDHSFRRPWQVKAALALYDYVNVVGRFNPNGPVGSTLLDWTAPGQLVKGNTMYPIRFDANGDPTLFGLASDFTIANLNAELRYTHFSPVQVWLTADLAKNIGYDGSDIAKRVGAPVDERTNAYTLQIDVGYPEIERFGEWHLGAYYRYLQRDAVLDGFTDSNFHLGGTDAKGFVLAGEYGIANRTWLRLRYYSVDEIDLAPLGIDSLHLELGTKF
ncbi:MAG TPA: putative porin [Gammaproteobacteria bacterium]|nr:putative porin [Gammaproteobacteria bacterium]